MDPQVRRAGELLDAGRPADAVAVLRAVLRGDDTDAAAWLLASEARRRLGLGDPRPAGGHRDAAVLAARRAAALVPASAAPRCALARALLLPVAAGRGEDLPGALAAARQAVQADDHSVEALLLLADLLELHAGEASGAADGDAGEPARLRERARRLDPDRAAASDVAGGRGALPDAGSGTVPGTGRGDTGTPDAGQGDTGTPDAGRVAERTPEVARRLVHRLSRWVLLPGALGALAVLAASAAAGRPVATAAVVAALEVAGAVVAVAATVRGRRGALTGVWQHPGPRVALVTVMLVVLVTLVPALVAVPAAVLAVAVLALLAGGAAAAVARRRGATARR